MKFIFKMWLKEAERREALQLKMNSSSSASSSSGGGGGDNDDNNTQTEEVQHIKRKSNKK